MRVGVIGAGYWGPNIVRNLHEAPGAEAVAVADLSQERLDVISKRFPSVRVTTDYRELVDDPSIDFVNDSVITTLSCVARITRWSSGMLLCVDCT